MRGGGQAEGALDVSVSREGQTEERAPGQSPATTQRHRLLVPRTTRHSWAPAQVSALQELRRGKRQTLLESTQRGNRGGGRGTAEARAPVCALLEGAAHPPLPSDHGRPAPLLTGVDVLLVSPQGVPALQPLPAAASLAHEPGPAPAGLLVLLTTAGRGRGGGCRGWGGTVTHAPSTRSGAPARRLGGEERKRLDSGAPGPNSRRP